MVTSSHIKTLVKYSLTSTQVKTSATSLALLCSHDIEQASQLCSICCRAFGAYSNVMSHWRRWSGKDTMQYGRGRNAIKTLYMMKRCTSFVYFSPSRGLIGSFIKRSCTWFFINSKLWDEKPCLSLICPPNPMFCTKIIGSNWSSTPQFIQLWCYIVLVHFM